MNALITIGLATIVFAILERFQARSHFLDDWNPLKLPPVRDPNQISRASSIFELALALVFFIWWALYASSRVINFGGAVRIELGIQWFWFFTGYLVLFLANAALAVFNLLHPHWTVRRAVFAFSVIASEQASSAGFFALALSIASPHFHLARRNHFI